MSRLTDRTARRTAAVRRKVKLAAGTSGRARLSVFRSSKHIYAQLIDDAKGKTLVAASSLAASAHEQLPLTAYRAVVIGYGPVGETVCRLLAENHVEPTVVELNIDTVHALRAKGIRAIYGDATRALVRDQAHCDTARLLIVTTPDPFQARHIIKKVREQRPDLPTVVRTHNEQERRFLKAQDVGRVVMGEQELAYGIAHYALMKMGRSDDEADERIAELRALE